MAKVPELKKLKKTGTVVGGEKGYETESKQGGGARRALW